MEVEQLEKAIARFMKKRNDPNEKALILWGGRTYTWTQMIMPKLTRQLHWLDSNVADEKYEDRLEQWLTLLHQYEKGCNLLIEAEAL